MRDFGAGLRTLLRGAGYWRHATGTMLWGLVPAVVVGLVFAAALIGWAFALPGLVDAWTPFADGWEPFWAGALRVAAGVAAFAGALFLVAATFTAVTIAVGEPAYDRIWRAVERRETGIVPDTPYGFWRAVGDGLRLIARGALAAVVAGAVGLVPVVGGVAGVVVGVLLTGWLLADELASRALTARGLDRAARTRLLRANRGRTLGFGVATQLCFLVPLGAVAVMPAAVAGATLLALDLGGPGISASSPSRRDGRG